MNQETQNEGTELMLTNDQLLTNDQPQAFKTVIGQTAGPLTQILMDNIRKVETDPGFIPQAKEIRDNVRELVNLARVEADMYREMRKTTK